MGYTSRTSAFGLSALQAFTPHGQHAGVPDRPGELAEPLVAEAIPERLRARVVLPAPLHERPREVHHLGLLRRDAARGTEAIQRTGGLVPSALAVTPAG